MPTTMIPPTQNGSFDSIRSWLAGSNKAAGALPEKGDGGESASTGARAEEYKKDLKKLLPGMNIEESADNPMTGDTDKPVPDSGLEATTAGKMPSVERAVKTVTEESEKMAIDLTVDAGFDAAYAALQKAAAELPILFAALGVPVQSPTPAPAAKQAAAAPTPNTNTAEPSDADVLGVVEQYRKYGSDRGAMTAGYLAGFYDAQAQMQKWADDGTLAAMAGAPPEAGGGAPPPDAGGGMPPGAGAMPPGAEGGMPPGAGGDAGQHQPSVDDLAAAMAEMGVDPEELQQVVDKLRAHMGGGADGGAGGAPGADAGGGGPPDMPAAEKEAIHRELAYVTKMASDVKAHRRSGHFRLKPAADGSPERARRDAGQKYIAELLRAAN